MSENNWTNDEIKWLEDNLGTKQYDDSYQIDEIYLHVTVRKDDFGYSASASDSLNLIETDDVTGETLKEAVANACRRYNELSTDINHARIECDCLIDVCQEPDLSNSDDEEAMDYLQEAMN